MLSYSFLETFCSLLSEAYSLTSEWERNFFHFLHGFSSLWLPLFASMFPVPIGDFAQGTATLDCLFLMKRTGNAEHWASAHRWTCVCVLRVRVGCARWARRRLFRASNQAVKRPLAFGVEPKKSLWVLLVDSLQFLWAEFSKFFHVYHISSCR